ncbi:MAG TPA: SDR family NAD(P)-dependent oxidoreductase [Stellaceae bacterium]|jgi:UDP-glucuronate 4-epimerase|nr:SDR family NAD(P)-dependent oxidoreductase [Stellaceae bacterium]
MSVLVTGAAGFIGFHVSQALLARGDAVVAIDNLNGYYDVALKRARLAQLEGKTGFAFERADIADRAAMSALVERHPEIDRVVHLAAQAGVRHSLENPYAYVDSNVMGHVTMLEASRRLPSLRAFVYASSSSVYGGNSKQPSSVEDRVDTPVSLYAATKRADELITHAYCHLYGIPATGLRFFTVYGPWGRPDMAAYLFADAIMHGRPIRVFNHGRMARDFTYIDDIVSGLLAALDRPPAQGVKGRIYNLGNHRPEQLLDFIAVLEAALGRTAEKELLPMEPGDVASSFADIAASRRDLGYEPKTPIAVGLPRFVAWYKAYHGLS